MEYEEHSVQIEQWLADIDSDLSDASTIDSNHDSGSENDEGDEPKKRKHCSLCPSSKDNKYKSSVSAVKLFAKPTV